MFLIGNFIHAIAVLLSYGLTIYIWIIIIRALISWVNPDPFNPIVQILHRLTDPVLEPVRRRLPDFGGLDVSPIVVLLVIFFLQNFLVASLMDMARLLR
ncbi:MAG: YggT family protein [Candidatus Tectomicrobia bacterium]|uniref:YggT family protein n=1 Tax=Tectimicrobiota bacterium TaxID=2528274 RepID=A0A932ZUS3_UNCTE|nr:YggT family protein [Candidatus Tectomicrobia bacterium]MBI4252492.1 YggT family protein [Candidatus Tectomicrobia bacterium]